MASVPEPAAPAPPPAGPGSVAWKVNREVAVLLGWGPAILMQFAHPLVAAGVAEHSAFSTDPTPVQRVRRLTSTLRAMLALTFGTPDEVARAAAGINRIHDYVHGRLREDVGVFPAGAPYSAHDPELLRWVQATILLCFPRACELYVGPLTPEEKDRYCLEASRIGPLLGMREDYLPRSTRELREYLDGMMAGGRIAVGADARTLARDLLAPFFPERLGWAYWPLRLTAVGLLPPEIRRMYGYPWRPSQERALRLMAALSRRVVPRLPGILRYWPIARRADGPAPGVAES